MAEGDAGAMTKGVTERIVTACPLDCPDSCSLEVTVSGGRVKTIEAGQGNPLTQNFICSKVRRFARRLYGEARIPRPGFRSGAKGEGQFRPVSWDQALDRIVEQLKSIGDRFGAESILPFSYGGSNGLLSHEALDQFFFEQLGASRLARTVCAAPTTRAATQMYGKMQGVSAIDYVHSRLIVIWGFNPSGSGIHLVPLIREAQGRGARLVVLDPRRTSIAKRADLHLRVRPGTDLVVALALLRWLFENGHADREFLREHTTGWQELRRRCLAWTLERAARESGLPASDLEALARLYAASSPAVIRCGWGLERNRNGGSAVAAILALPAVAGKFRVRGGGYSLSDSGAWLAPGQGSEEEEKDRPRTINMNRLGRALGEAVPPVQGLFVYSCNPLVTVPDQERVRRGLSREDLFTVVFDQVMTDTARYADVILPATTFLEHRDLARGYGSAIVQRVVPVVEPVGQARSNFDVFRELCERLGYQPPVTTVEDLEHSSALRLDGSGQVWKAVRDAGHAHPASGFNPILFKDVFPLTPDRKVHLVPASLDREAPRGLYFYSSDPTREAFPLTLISPAATRTICSTFGELHRELARLLIHPQDAAARGISEEDRVVVSNHLGEVRCGVRISEDTSAGTVVLAKGLWSHNTLNGRTSNALVPDTLTDLGAGACFNDARVQVRRLPEDS